MENITCHPSSSKNVDRKEFKMLPISITFFLHLLNSQGAYGFIKLICHISSANHMIDIKHTTDLDRSTSVTLNMICVNYIWLNLERGSPLSTPGKRIVLTARTKKLWKFDTDPDKTTPKSIKAVNSTTTTKLRSTYMMGEAI